MLDDCLLICAGYTNTFCQKPPKIGHIALTANNYEEPSELEIILGWLSAVVHMKIVHGNKSTTFLGWLFND